MRIVAGQWGGRRLDVPQGRDVRPTSDKVRGAIFNMLRGFDAVDSAVVLDAFCGSGALGLEALSRGAKACIFIDRARASLEFARRNAIYFEALEVCDFYALDSSKDVTYRKFKNHFNLVFLDPPYRKDILDSLLKNNHFFESLRDGAFIVVETEKEFRYDASHGFEMLQNKKYGDTQIFLLRYSKNVS